LSERLWGDVGIVIGLDNMTGPHTFTAAISTCWMMLPEEKRNPEAVADEIRRIVERALANLKEDATAFGFMK
jgi:hypothetical protein